MKPDACLVSEVIYNALGNVERINYDWTGGEVAFLSFSDVCHLTAMGSMQKDGDVVTVGSLRLRIVDAADDSFPLGIYVMQDGLRALIKSRFYPLVRIIDLIYRRLVITAAVWNLADFNAAVIPTWKDIYLLKKIANRIKK